MKNSLEVDSVILEFGFKRILQDVYLKSETGKTTGLLGRNGSGKSSLMKILFGELIPDSKSIRVNGRALLGTYRSPREMRYLPQDNFIPGTLTVARVLMDFELDFGDLITNFSDLSNHRNSKLRNLSGGQRRIIEIYSILVSESKLIR